MNERPYAIHRRDLVWLALVLVVAAVLRLGRADVLHFQYDQAEVTILAQEFVSGQYLSLIGQQSSSGLPNSPMAHILLGLPFALLRGPQGVTLAIAAWNVIGVGLLWLLAHRYLNPRVAVLAGLLYAVSPYAVRWSRSIWIQNLHTPFILLALGLALYGFVERRRWAQAVMFPIALIGAQIHYAGWFLLPLIAAPVWWGRRNIDWRAVGIGVLLALLVLLPFGIGLVQHYGGDLAALAGGQEDAAPLRLRGKVFERYLPLFTGQGSESLGGGVAADLLASVPVPLGLWTLLGLFSIVGIVTPFLPGQDRKLGVGLLLWLVLPPLVFWLNWTGVYWHYFVASLPGLALATALGADWLAETLLARWRQAARGVVYGLVGIVALSQGLWSMQALDWMNTHYTPHGFSTPLRQSLEVRDAMLGVDDVLILGGQSSYSGYEVWKALLYHDASTVREVVVNGGNIAVFPSGPFAVLIAPRAAPYPLAGLYDSGASQVFPLRPAAQPGGEDEGAYRVDLFDAAPEWPGPEIAAIQPATFANGVQVTGFTLAEGQLWTAWALPAAPGRDAPQFRYFAHFLDDQGERVAQQDFDFWAARYWRAEDRVILWGALEVPPEAVTLRLGMYSIDPAGAINGLDAYDSAGAAAPWVDLPLAGALDQDGT